MFDTQIIVIIWMFLALRLTSSTVTIALGQFDIRLRSIHNSKILVECKNDVGY